MVHPSSSPQRNPAARVGTVIARALSERRAEPSAVMWARVLEATTDTPLDRDCGVTVALGHLLDQVDLATHQLGHLGHRIDAEFHETFVRDFDTVRTLLGVEHLWSGWHELRPRLTHDAVFAFGVAAELLGTQEAPIDADALRLLRNQVASWERAVRWSGLPHEMAWLLHEQLAQLRRALLAYPFVGVAALRQAVAAYGAALSPVAPLLRSKAPTLWPDLVEVWVRIVTLCDAAATVTIFGAWNAARIAALHPMFAEEARRLGLWTGPADVGHGDAAT
jgi:hypothetical protein